MFIVFFIAFVLSRGVICEIPIVAFFNAENSEQQELAFRLAVERVNNDRGYLQDKLIASTEYVRQYDSFNISRRICNLTMGGIGAIIGPPSMEPNGVLQAISNKLSLPYVQTHWDTSTLPPINSLNLYPESLLLAKAMVAVIQDMDWGSYTILYETEEALQRLQGLLTSHPRGVTSEGRVPFTVWHLVGGPDESYLDYRPVLKQVEQSLETHIVLDCSVDHIKSILEQAREVGMMGDYHSYLLTNIDAHTVDFGDFKQGTTNITTLRLVDPHRHMVQAAVQDWKELARKRPLIITADTVQTESALMNDAVNLIATAFHKLSKSSIIQDPINEDTEMSVTSLMCDGNERWDYGEQMMEYMKLMEMEGMTGKIKFDEKGRRTFFTLDISELNKMGFRKIGSWDPENGMTYSRTKHEMESERVQSISSKKFIVVSRLGPPYLRYKDENAEGNAKFEGYSLDLIDEIAKELNFSYQFVLTPDGAYGKYNPETKQWDGLIRELRDRRADLAICDLTITYERRSAVDFTKPFMTLGISILYSKPAKQSPDLFSFLSPLSLDVWIYMATAYLGVSLLLYFLARCTPHEWENPHPCNTEPTEVECAFSLHNCLWFSIGSLMCQGCDILPKISPAEWKNPHPCAQEPQELENDLTLQNSLWHNTGSLMLQGSDIAPQAISTRTVAAMWWFFVLIITASYTANLAAFLTMERMDATIGSVEDLAKQNKVKYGAMIGGSTADFFRLSNNSLYQKMWSFMESTRPSVFVKTNDEGVERVLKSKRAYAFLMESTSIQYQEQKHCELMQVGGTLDSKGYGIAMPFNSPYRIPISGAVLKMQETGKLFELKERWWKGAKEGPACASDDGAAVDSAELGIDNVGGVFLVLIAGVGAAFLVSILEFLWNVRKVAVQEKLTLQEALTLELKFAFSCDLSTKPVRHTAGSEDESEKEKSTSPIEKTESFLKLRDFDDMNVD